MIHKAIKISPGLIHWNKDRFEKDIQSYKDGTELYIDITDKKPSCSKQARGYLHLSFDRIAKETQEYTPAEIKCMIKEEAGMCHWFTNKRGEQRPCYDSSENLNKEQYSNLIELTVRLAAERGVVILLPEEYFET